MFKLIGKRFTSMALAVIMLLTMLPMEAVAEQVLTLMEPLSEVPAFESTVIPEEEEPAAELVEISVLDPETEIKPEPEDTPVEDLPMDSVADLLQVIPEETEPEAPVQEEEVVDDMSMASIAMMLVGEEYVDDNMGVGGVVPPSLDTTNMPETMTAAEAQAYMDYILYTYLGYTPDMGELTTDQIGQIVVPMYGEDPDRYAAMESDVFGLVEIMGTSIEEGMLTEEDALAMVSEITPFGRLYIVLDELRTMSQSLMPIATVNVLDGQVSISDTAGNNTVSGGTVTVKASGGLSRAGNTITITNESGNTATISFDYSISNQNDYNVNGEKPGTSGSVSKLLENGASVSIYIQSKRFSTVTLTMSNFSLVEAATSSNVTFEFDSNLGSITVGGTAVASGTTQEVSLSEGAALVATPKSGASFLAWINGATGEILSKEASCTLSFATDMTVKALFDNGTGDALFLVNNLYLYDDLNKANTAALSATNKTIVLYNNGTLPAGNYTIGSGVTLLIPNDASNTVRTTSTQVVTAYTTPTAYRTLTMASGANITVNGAMSVPAAIKAANTTAGEMSCAPVGPAGFVRMQENSNITVNGALYAYGFITGSGSVTANSGATVYEVFQIADFRGGTVTTSSAMKNAKIFPLSQYYIQNIEVPMTIYSGATVKMFLSLNVSGMQPDFTLTFVAPSGDNLMFKLTDGYMVKRYDGSNDRLVLDINGNVTLCSIQMGFYAIIFNLDINSADFNLPITNNFDVHVKSGTITIGQDVALLPGAKITVYEAAKCVLGSGSDVYVYDVDEWGNYCGSNNQAFCPLLYAPGKTGSRTIDTDACILIKGEADLKNGFVYTTNGGACICGADGGIVKMKKGTATVTYQADQYTNSNGDPDVKLVNIPISSAKLKNADDSYANTANLPDTTNEYIFTYTEGKWVCETHTEVDDAAVDAKCTNPGKTAGKHCSVCGMVTVAQTEIPALGHKVDNATSSTPATCMTEGLKRGICQNGCSLAEVEVVIPVDPNAHNMQQTESKIEATCGMPGKEAVQTCQNGCGHTTGGGIISATGNHSWDNGVVSNAATCVDKGSMLYTCDVCDATETRDIQPTGNHTEVTDDAVAATCTTPGKTEGKHCSVCNTVIIAQTGTSIDSTNHPADKIENVDAVPGTCVTAGTSAGTRCTACRATVSGLQETSIDPDNHDWVAGTYVDPTCVENGYTPYSCQREGCDATKKVENPNTATGIHTHAEGAEGVVKAPTCVAKGYTTYTCMVCSQSYQADEQPIDRNAHDLERVKAKPATYAEAGHEEYDYCKREGCDYTTWNADKVIPQKIKQQPVIATTDLFVENVITDTAIDNATLKTWFSVKSVYDDVVDFTVAVKVGEEQANDLAVPKTEGATVNAEIVVSVADSDYIKELVKSFEIKITNPVYPVAWALAEGLPNDIIEDIYISGKGGRLNAKDMIGDEAPYFMFVKVEEGYKPTSLSVTGGNIDGTVTLDEGDFELEENSTVLYKANANFLTKADTQEQAAVPYTISATAEKKTFTVTILDENGNALKDNDKEFSGIYEWGYELVLPTTLTKAADAQYTYTFAGWDKLTNSGYDNVPDLDAGKSLIVYEDATYKAYYSKVTNTYTITWLNYDGTVLETDEGVPYGTTPVYNGATPTKPDGVEDDGKTYVYTFANKWNFEIANVTGNREYTAEFNKELKKVTVTFRGEGFEDVPVSIEYNTKVTAPEVNRTGNYELRGWVNEAGNAYDFDTLVTEDITLTAVWVKTYVVRFDKNEGNITPDYAVDEQTVDQGLFAKDPTDVAKEKDTEIEYNKNGYAFRFWCDNSVGEIEAFDFEKTPITDDIQLVAIWGVDVNGNKIADVDEPKYTIIYTDGVEGDEVFVTQNKGSDWLKGQDTPAFEGTPFRPYYVFAGWYEDKDNDQQKDADESIIGLTITDKISGNKTYAAYWEADTNNSGVADKDEKATVTVGENGSVTITEDGEAFGFESGKEFLFNSTKTYTITMTPDNADVEDGNGCYVQSVKVNGTDMETAASAEAGSVRTMNISFENEMEIVVAFGVVTVSAESNEEAFKVNGWSKEGIFETYQDNLIAENFNRNATVDGGEFTVEIQVGEDWVSVEDLPADSSVLSVQNQTVRVKWTPADSRYPTIYSMPVTAKIVEARQAPVISTEKIAVNVGTNIQNEFITAVKTVIAERLNTTGIAAEDIEVVLNAAYNGTGDYTISAKVTNEGESWVASTAATEVPVQVKVKEYTITWDTNGEDVADGIETTLVEYGRTPNPPTPADREKEDKSFAGWKKDDTQLVGVTAVTGNATYIATYSDDKVWTITINVDGSNTPLYINETQGETVAEPEDPDKDNCLENKIFGGWFCDAEYKVEATEENVFGKVPTTNIDLYAKLIDETNNNNVPDENETITVSITGTGSVSIDDDVVTNGSYVFDSTKAANTVVIKPNDTVGTDGAAGYVKAVTFGSVDQIGNGKFANTVYTGAIDLENGQILAVEIGTASIDANAPAFAVNGYSPAKILEGYKDNLTEAKLDVQVTKPEDDQGSVAMQINVAGAWTDVQMLTVEEHSAALTVSNQDVCAVWTPANTSRYPTISKTVPATITEARQIPTISEEAITGIVANDETAFIAEIQKVVAERLNEDGFAVFANDIFVDPDSVEYPAEYSKESKEYTVDVKVANAGEGWLASDVATEVSVSAKVKEYNIYWDVDGDKTVDTEYNSTAAFNTNPLDDENAPKHAPKLEDHPNGWTAAPAENVTKEGNIRGEVTYTAQYSPDIIYEITFMDGDTECEDLKQRINLTKDPNAVIPDHKLDDPLDDDVTFIGWKNITDGNGKKPGEKPDADATFRAIWVADINNNNTDDETETYTVIYDAGYEGGTPVNFECELNISTPTIEDPVRDGYHFNGWNPKVAEKVTAPTSGTTITYTAQWVVDANGNKVNDTTETITVSITGSGTVTVDDVPVFTSQNVLIDSTKDANVIVVKPADATTGYADYVLSAKVNEYDLTSEANGGSFSKAVLTGSYDLKSDDELTVEFSKLGVDIKSGTFKVNGYTNNRTDFSLLLEDYRNILKSYAEDKSGNLKSKGPDFGTYTAEIEFVNNEWWDATELEDHTAGIYPTVAQRIHLVWNGGDRYPVITSPAYYLTIQESRAQVDPVLQNVTLSYKDWSLNALPTSAELEELLAEFVEIPEGESAVYSVEPELNDPGDGETYTGIYTVRVLESAKQLSATASANLTIKNFKDINGNNKDDDLETITVKVVKAAEDDVVKIDGVAWTEEAEYVFDSTAATKITILATPVVDEVASLESMGMERFSKTYVASIKRGDNEETLETSNFNKFGYPAYSYLYEPAALENGDVITITFAEAEFTYTGEVMEYYPGKYNNEDIHAAVYDAFVSAPASSSGNVLIQYTARKAQAQPVEINLADVIEDKLLLNELAKINGNSTTLKIALSETKTDIDDNRNRDVISPELAAAKWLNAEAIRNVLSAEAPEEALKKIIGSIRSDLLFYGEHTFGYNADAAGTTVTEDVEIIYESNAMRVVEVAQITLRDPRKASVIDAKNVSFAYKTTNMEALKDAIGATLNGAASDAITYTGIENLVKAVAGEYELTLKFAGDETYKPAEKTVQVTIKPAEAALSVDPIDVDSLEKAALMANYPEGTAKDVKAELNAGLIRFIVDLDKASVRIILPEWVSGVSSLDDLKELLPTAAAEKLQKVIAVVDGINGKEPVDVVIGAAQTAAEAKEADAYLYGVLTTSTNYTTAFDMNYLLVNNDQDGLAFDFTQTEGVFTRELLEHVHYGTTAFSKSVFFSTGRNGDPNRISLETDPAALKIGKVYTQIAFVSGQDPIVRDFKIIDNDVDVQVIDPEGKKFLRLFDNDKQAMQAVMPEGEYTGKLTLTYKGTMLNAEGYGPWAETAPTNAGVYEATALYIGREEGKVNAIGIDVQPFAVVPAPSIVKVDDATIEKKDLPESGFDVYELVTAKSSVEGYGEPDTTVIAAGVAFDGDMTLKNATGTVYVNMPQWLNDLLKKMVPGLFDGTTITVETFLGKIDALVNEYGVLLDQIDIQGINVKAMLTEVTASLREIVNQKLDVVITTGDSMKLKDFGVYAVVGIVTDINHLPFAEAGVVMITPELVDVKIANRNVVAIVDGAAHGVDVVVTGKNEAGEAIEIANTAKETGALANLKVTYTGLQTNLMPYSSTVAPSHAGAYSAVAVYAEKGENGEIIAAGMDIGAVAILPTTSSVTVVKSNPVKLEGEYANGYPVRNMVTASSKIEGMIPNTTVITAKVPLGKELTLDNAYEAHLDLPAWLDPMIDKYLPNNDKRISTDGFIAILKQLNDEYGSLLADVAGSKLNVKAVVDQVISSLDQLPGSLTLQLCENCTVTESGAYIVVGIVTDSQHIPSVDAGVLVVAPEFVNINFVGADKNNQYLFTYTGEAQKVEITAERIGDNSEPINPDNLKLYYIGVESTPNPGYFRTEAPDQTGIYGLLAYYYEEDANGGIKAIGMNLGSMIIKPAKASIDVATGFYKNGVTTNDVVLVKNEKGEADETIAKTIITAGVPLKANVVGDALALIQTEMDGVKAGQVPDLTPLLGYLGYVNIDMPAWLKTALAEFGFDGDITIATLKNAVQPLRDAYYAAKKELVNGEAGSKLDAAFEKVMGQLGSMVDVDLEALKPILQQAENNVIETLDILVDLLDKFDENLLVKITTDSNYPLNETGIYLIAAGVTDTDYMPTADIGVAVVAPNAVDLKILDDEAHNNLVYTGSKQALPISINGTVYENVQETVPANVQMFYVGVASDGMMYASKDAPVNSGIYMEVAVYAEADANGVISVIGMDKGIMTIKPATTQVNVNGVLKDVMGGIYTNQGLANGLKDTALVSTAADTETEKVDTTVISVGVSLSEENLTDALFGRTDAEGNLQPGDLKVAYDALEEPVKEEIRKLLSDVIAGKDLHLKQWAADLITKLTKDIAIEDLLPLLKYVDSVNVTTPDWIYDLLKLILGKDSGIKIDDVEMALNSIVKMLESFDTFKTELEAKEEIQKVLDMANSIGSVKEIYDTLNKVYDTIKKTAEPAVDLVQDALAEFDDGLIVNFHKDGAELNKKGLYLVAGIVTDGNYMPSIGYDAVVLLPDIANDIKVTAPENLTYDPDLTYNVEVEDNANAQIKKLIYVGVNTHGELVMQEDAPIEPGVYAAVAVQMVLKDDVVEEVHIGLDILMINPLEANVEVKGLMNALEGDLQLNMDGLKQMVGKAMGGVYETTEAVETRGLVTATPVNGEDAEPETTVVTAGVELNAETLGMVKGDLEPTVKMLLNMVMGIVGGGEVAMPDMSMLLDYIDYVNVVNVDLPEWVRELLADVGLDLDDYGNDVTLKTLKDALTRIEAIYDAANNAESGSGTISEVLNAIESVRPGTVDAVMSKLNGVVPGALGALKSVLNSLNEDLVITTYSDYKADVAGAYAVVGVVTDPYYLPGIDLKAMASDPKGYLVSALTGMLPDMVGSLLGGMLPESGEGTEIKPLTGIGFDAILVVPELMDVQVTDSTRTYGLNNNKQDLVVKVNGNEIVRDFNNANDELSMFYVGLRLDGTPYMDPEVPTDAGVYLGIALYTPVNADTGAIETIGFNMGILDIVASDKLDVKFDQDSLNAVYDGAAHVPSVIYKASDVETTDDSAFAIIGVKPNRNTLNMFVPPEAQVPLTDFILLVSQLRDAVDQLVDLVVKYLPQYEDNVQDVMGMLPTAADLENLSTLLADGTHTMEEYLGDPNSSDQLEQIGKLGMILKYTSTLPDMMEGTAKTVLGMVMDKVIGTLGTLDMSEHDRELVQYICDLLYKDSAESASGVSMSLVKAVNRKLILMDNMVEDLYQYMKIQHAQGKGVTTITINDPTSMPTEIGEYPVFVIGYLNSNYEMARIRKVETPIYDEDGWETGEFIITYEPADKGTLRISQNVEVAFAEDMTFTYGDQLPDIKDLYTVDGAEDVNDLISISITDANGEPIDLASIQDAGKYQLIAKANHAGYVIVDANGKPVVDNQLIGTLVIEPKAVSVTAVDASKVYGEDDPEEFTATVEGMVGDDTLDYTVSRATGENVGTYDITVALGQNPNYDVSVTNGTFTITKKAVTITADDNGKIYGAAEPILTATVAGKVGTDTLNYSVSRVDGENVGTYAINVTPGENRNYEVTAVPGTFTISPKAATVTVKAGQNKVYGAAEPEELAVTVDGVLAGDTLNYSVSREDGEDVGTYPITVTLLKNPNYTVTAVPGTFEITKKAATVTVKAGQNKVYGAAEPEELAVTVNGTVGDDTLNYSVSRTTGENVGTYTITVTPGQNPNYDVSVTNGTFEITKKAATITADNKTKVYGESNPILTATVAGTIGTETLNYSVTRATGENVGTYAITVTPGQNPNYDVSVTNGTFTITKKAVTITADDNGKIYGAAEPTLTATVAGKVGTETLNYSVSRVAGENVGTYTITVTPGQNPNYEVTAVPGDFEITKKAATITADNKSKVYGAADPTLTATVKGTLAGDTLNYSVSRVTNENAGTYDITVKLGENPNYDVSVKGGIFQIAKKAVTVTANAVSKEYGDADPALTAKVVGEVEGDPVKYTLERDTGEAADTYAIKVVKGENPNYNVTAFRGVFTIEKAKATIKADNLTMVYGATEPELTATVTGTKNGEKLKYTLDREEGSAVGTYKITVTRGNNPNYDVTVEPGVFTITEPDIINLYVNIQNAEKVYGTDDAFTYTAVDEDGKAVELKNAKLEVIREQGEDAGEYAFTAKVTGADADKYNIVSISKNVFTITRAKATVTADNKTKEYDGKVAELSATVTGLVGDDTVKYDLECTAVNAGEHVITASGEAEQGNYDVVFVNGKLNITRAKATVTAEDKTKVYGEVDPALTAKVEGLVNGDAASVISYKLNREAGVNADTYTITASGEAVQGNYDVVFANGELTITRAKATVTAEDKTKEYGAADPALTAKVEGLVNGDAASVISYKLNREAGVNVGTYAITASGEAVQGNYDVAYKPGVFTIEAKKVELAVKDMSITYGDELPAELKALMNTEGVKVVITDAAGKAVEPAALKAAGEYTITAAAANTNYDVSGDLSGKLVIKPMDVTVTVSNAAMVYGGDVPAPMATVKDAKGNAITGLEISFKAYKAADGEEIAIADLANADAGNYIIKAVLDNSNYNVVSYVDGNITIEPKTIYIDIDDEPITITEGETMPEEIAYTLSDETGAITGDALAALIEELKPAINVMDGDVAIDVEAADPGEYAITAETANGNYMLAVRTEGVLVIQKHAGRIIDTGRTLTLDGVIYIEQYVKVEGFEDIDVSKNGGMLIWEKSVSGELTEAEAVVGHALAQNKEGLNDLGSEYHQRTDGIVTKKYADEVYLRTYVKIGKDRYVYGPLKEFSVQIYCEGRINKNGREKDVCIAMLHLGAEAQKYFKYGLDDLANANIKDLYPSKDYDISMVDALNMDYSYDFAVSDKVIDNGKTLSLEGAVLIDAFYQFEGEVASAELLAWKEVSGKLDLADAIVSEMELDKGEYHGRSPMFASKRYGDTVYLCARFTDTDGNVYYSEVDAFSPDYYCQRRIDRASREEEVAKKMVIYSEEARAYFKY